MELAGTTLALFFTKRMSLKKWADIGILEREIELYKRLATYLKRVNMVTYGDSYDKPYSTKIGDIKVLPVSWYKRTSITILRLLTKHFFEIKNSDILKTNQIQGSEIPLWLKRKFKKKLIVRCGYLHSLFKFRQTKDKTIRNKAHQLERDAFSFADMGVVTSPKDRDYVLKKYEIMPEKITVIPNYVVTEFFKPIPEIQKKYDLVFVGRGGNQKNIENLLQAISHLKKEKRSVSLIMVGPCCYDTKFKQIINRYAIDATLKGIVPNFELPKIINQARLFILPSYYEGHPKVLLEAMSCGLPCIGTDVAGIREDIEHLITGYLCETGFKSIAEAIDALLSDESLQIKLGRNARKYILTKYSLDKVLQKEIEVIKEVLAS